MSRLYLHLDRHLSSETLTPCTLRRVLRDFLESHAALSTRAEVRITFDHLIRRAALASEHSGWRAYPVEIEASLHGGDFSAELSVSVQYSSTCPASAALARQLIQERFSADFADGQTIDREEVRAWLGSAHGILATPHAWQSTCCVRYKRQSRNSPMSRNGPKFGGYFRGNVDFGSDWRNAILRQRAVYVDS